MFSATRLFLLSLGISVLTGWNLPAMAEDWTDVLQISDASKLDKHGATSIQVRVQHPKDTDEGYPKGVWLEGLKDGKVLWKKTFPVKEGVNTAKTDVVANGKNTIVIYSQMPGSANTCIQEFNWNGDALTLKKSHWHDASQELVSKCIDLALHGTSDQYTKYVEPLDSGDRAIMYPGNYINADTLTNLIKEGDKVALALGAKGNNDAAADRLALVFDCSTDLMGYAGSAESGTSQSDTWIKSWDAFELPATTYGPALNDYAYFLQKVGEHDDAIPIFRVVISKLPDRTPAYLNLADSLWAKGKKAEAKEYYAQYLGKLEDKTKAPPRVMQRK